MSDETATDRQETGGSKDAFDQALENYERILVEGGLSEAEILVFVSDARDFLSFASAKGVQDLIVASKFFIEYLGDYLPSLGGEGLHAVERTVDSLEMFYTLLTDAGYLDASATHETRTFLLGIHDALERRRRVRAFAQNNLWGADIDELADQLTLALLFLMGTEDIFGQRWSTPTLPEASLERLVEKGYVSLTEKHSEVVLVHRGMDEAMDLLEKLLENDI